MIPESHADLPVSGIVAMMGAIIHERMSAIALLQVRAAIGYAPVTRQSLSHDPGSLIGLYYSW